MAKLNQSGSHILVGIIVIVVLGAIGAAGYTVYHKQSTGSGSSSPRTDKAGSSATSDGLVSRISLECVPRGHDYYRTNETLAIDQSNANVMYVGVEYKGVYKSVNGGSTWKQSDTGIRGYAKEGDATQKCVQELGKTIIDPADSKHLLISRVESPGDNKTRFSENAGLWESKNAGATWRQIIRPGMNMSGSRAIAFAPGDSKTIFYGVNNGHPSYTEGGKAPDEYFNTKGILYKTTNGGSDWAELPTGATKGLRASNVGIDAKNHDIMWLFTFYQDPKSGGVGSVSSQKGAMKTTDGGKTWTSYASKLPSEARTLASGVMNPLDSNNVFVSSQSMNGPSKSYVTTDGGNSWKQSNQAVYVTKFDSNDPTGNRVIGYDPFSSGGGGIYESLNKGATWSRLSGVPAGVNNSDRFGVRIEGFAMSAAAKGTIYMSGSNANVWKSTDNGKTWKNILTIDAIGGQNKNKEGNVKSREQDPSAAH